MLPTAPISALYELGCHGWSSGGCCKGADATIFDGAREEQIRWHKNRAPSRFRCRRSTTRWVQDLVIEVRPPIFRELDLPICSALRIASLPFSPFSPRSGE